MLDPAVPLHTLLHQEELTGVVASPATPSPELPGFPVLHAAVGPGIPTVLPHLPKFKDDHLSNILLLSGADALDRRAVLDLALACARVLRPAGRLLMLAPESWRIGRGELTLLLESAGFRLLDLPGIGGEESRVILAENAPEDVARGLDRIQSVLAWDAKNATYKFALIRALCRVGRTASHAVKWESGRVLVPLRLLSIAWLEFYWPLLTSPDFIAQRHGERARPVAFRRAIEELGRRHGPSALPRLLDEIDTGSPSFDRELRKIGRTIVVGPVQHSGLRENPLFAFERSGDDDGLGWVAVPTAVWLDLVRFDHWIEDSVVIRWARLTADMNPATTAARFLPLLLPAEEDRRDTTAVRSALGSDATGPLACVWTGRPLTSLHIDHVVPFSVWGNNDLWNLLPATPRANLAKSDRLPSHELLGQREEAITGYWRIYSSIWDDRFAGQLRRALGADPDQPGWEGAAFGGMSELIERLRTTRGIRPWNGSVPG